LESNPKDEIYQLVERRFRGLQNLRKLLGDAAMDYQELGGYEVFRNGDRELMEKSLDQIEEINRWLFPIFNRETYRNCERDFGFKNTIGAIETPFEGHIHTGKMMRAYLKLLSASEVNVLNNLEVKKLTELNSKVELELENGFRFQAS